MSGSDSSDEEAPIPRNRRRHQKSPKNVPKKKGKKAPMRDTYNKQRVGKKRKDKVGSFSETSDSEYFSADSVENHPPKGKGHKGQNNGKNAQSSADELEVNGRTSLTNLEQPGPGVPEDPMNNDDDAEKRMRQRRRLSKSFQASKENSANKSLDASGNDYSTEVITDRATLKSIYSTCIQLFQAHKITQQNAFSLKLLECLHAIITGPDFDRTDMHMIGQTLEAGTRIYVCRVDHTHAQVLNLAAEITVHANKVKEIEKERLRQENGEGGDANEDGENVAAELLKKTKKKKHSRFIEEDESKLLTDFEGQSTKYVTRRETLKRKFNRMIDEELDFDYISCFKAQDEVHPLELDDENHQCEYVAVVPVTHINSEDAKRINFLDFNLLTKFDPAIFDIWGAPSNTDEANVSECQQPHMPDINQEFAYNPENRQGNYDADMFGGEGDDFHNMSQEIEQGLNLEENHDNCGVAPPVQLHSIMSLDQLGQYFDAIKNVQKLTKDRYGWAGPQFFQPRRNWLRPNTESAKLKKRKKKEALDINFDDIDWKDNANKYVSTSKEKTVLDEKTIEKWSFCRTSVPFLGLESGNCGYDMLDAYANPLMEDEDSPDYVPPLLRFFVDPNRNIATLLEKEIEKYGHVRDAAEFTNEDGDFKDDFFAPYDDDEFARENPSFCGSNGLVNDVGAIPDDAAVVDPLATLASIFPGSLGLNFEDDFMTKATEATESVKFLKQPKLINMQTLKADVTRVLTLRLKLDENGRATQIVDTSCEMLDLLQYVILHTDKRLVEHLTIAIVMVALMHVVADKHLFLAPGKTGDVENPLIICRGRLWQHADNIPKGSGISGHGEEEKD